MPFLGGKLDGKITELSGKRKSYFTVNKKCLQKKRVKTNNKITGSYLDKGKTPKNIKNLHTF